MPVIVWMLLAVALLLLVIARAVVIVPSGRVGLVERLGRYERTVRAGLSVVIPIVEQVRFVVHLGEQVSSLSREMVITQDNYLVAVDALIHVDVVDPVAASYQVEDHREALRTLIVAALRTEIGEMESDVAVRSTYELGNAVRAAAAETAGRWGLRINRVEIKALARDSTGP